MVVCRTGDTGKVGLSYGKAEQEGAAK